MEENMRQKESKFREEANQARW